MNYASDVTKKGHYKPVYENYYKNKIEQLKGE